MTVFSFKALNALCGDALSSSSINVLDMQSKSALHLATECNHEAIVEALVRHCADKRCKDEGAYLTCVCVCGYVCVYVCTIAMHLATECNFVIKRNCCGTMQINAAKTVSI